MPETRVGGESPPRRGRPPGTSTDELELIALRLFSEHGFDGTTVEMIATEAGTSKRTFFRYYDSKAAVLWREFDVEVDALRDQLDALPDDLPIMAAVRRAVVAVNHYRAADADELRARMSLIGSVPELAASAATHYDAWERVIAEYVGRRSEVAAESLLPLAVGRVTLAACRAAYERWVELADADLTVYLDAALAALSAGFTDDVIVSEPRPDRVS